MLIYDSLTQSLTDRDKEIDKSGNNVGSFFNKSIGGIIYRMDQLLKLKVIATKKISFEVPLGAVYDFTETTPDFKPISDSKYSSYNLVATKAYVFYEKEGREKIKAPLALEFLDDRDSGATFNSRDKTLTKNTEGKKQVDLYLETIEKNTPANFLFNFGRTDKPADVSAWFTDLFNKKEGRTLLLNRDENGALTIVNNNDYKWIKANLKYFNLITFNSYFGQWGVNGSHNYIQQYKYLPTHLITKAHLYAKYTAIRQSSILQSEKEVPYSTIYDWSISKKEKAFYNDIIKWMSDLDNSEYLTNLIILWSKISTLMEDPLPSMRKGKEYNTGDGDNITALPAGKPTYYLMRFYKFFNTSGEEAFLDNRCVDEVRLMKRKDKTAPFFVDASIANFRYIQPQKDHFLCYSEFSPNKYWNDWDWYIDVIF